jgi:hypothetical protein
MNAAAIVTVVGSVLTLLGVAFTARATTRAAQATARANQAAAQATVEPNQRAEDRAAFEAVKKELREELTSTREEVKGLRSLVRAFAWYVGELTSQMRHNGIEPPAPPQRVDEYNRTGV